MATEKPVIVVEADLVIGSPPDMATLVVRQSDGSRLSLVFPPQQIDRLWDKLGVATRGISLPAA